MIGFVMPIKPKLVSKDWDYDTKLFERSIKSICAQTDQNFKVVIVYNDLPKINFIHPNIFYVHYPFQTVLADEIEDLDFYVPKYYAKQYAEKMMDKSKKIFYGCKTAFEKGCSYIMSIDSDDLISNKIAEYVNSRIDSKVAGWRILKGFIYQEDSLMLIKKYDIQNMNGSTHIIRKDLITIPDFSTNLFFNYNLFEAHAYTYGRIKDFHNELLGDIDFFGVVYIVHKNNYSNIGNIMKSRPIRNFLKKIIKGRYLNEKIRKEYNLYNL